ncbi:hypothetical protein BDW59DRAFT_145564 [Aspergillus cavernicola]|uniref:ZZ-type domain-containing protein n=1 Tax=Aspergillus cavernicola TaxID=176166 RepID=A0ABR4IEE5_9EURO
MSLYKCTSCTEAIRATKPRLACTSCAPLMTLCANCYVVQDYPQQHQQGDPSHSILLHKYSGFLPAPPPPPPRPQSLRSPPLPSSYTSGPPRRRPTSAAYIEVPPRKPPRPTTVTEPKHEPEERQNPPTPQPPTPSSQCPPQPTGWTSFFNQDMTPSPTFLRLIEELFHHLDPQRTEFITPELYSEYLDACGAPSNHNIWKHSRTTNNSTDMADRELTDHFTAYSVDFTLRPRTPPATPELSPLDPLSYLPPAQRASLSRFMPPNRATSLSGGQKPLLSFRGWTSLTITSVLLNPSAAWIQLSRVMREFAVPVWRENGDLPREMVPLEPFQPEVERVGVLLEGARANAEREVDAVKARLDLEKRGRENALDLLDDRVWVYR